MARVKILVKTVKASSLLEVIVAMVLIMIIFGIAINIFVNVTRTTLPINNLQTNALLEDRLIAFENRSETPPDTTSTNSIRIVQELLPYTDDSRLNIIHLTAYDRHDRMVGQISKIIRIRHD